MYLKLSQLNTTGFRDAQNGWVVGCGGVKKRWTLTREERELFLASKGYITVYLGVKTYEVFFCLVPIVRIRLYCDDFFVFFVLHHW